MTEAIYLMLWASSTVLLLSIGALLVGGLLLRRLRLSSLSVLSERLSELEQTVESLTGQLRAIRQRDNMRAYRYRKEADKQQETTEPTDDPAAIRATLNDQLARGAIKGP